MRRSILFSLMVIGAVIAVVAGASTFSAFTSQDTISGGVTAGTLKISITDDGAESLSFDPTAACGEMVPGEPCTTTLVVSHGSPSNLEFTYLGDIAESLDTSDCFTATLSFVSSSPATSPGFANPASPANNSTANDQFGHVAADNGSGDVTDALDPGDTDTFSLSVSVDDDNTCQGKTASYLITVDASQSPTPHN